jgi:hypothetical protein
MAINACQKAKLLAKLPVDKRRQLANLTDASYQAH